MQQAQGVSLVVVGRGVTECPRGKDHRVLLGVAFAGSVSLDGLDRDTLIRHFVCFAPALQRGKKASIGVSSIGANVATHFLEDDQLDTDELVQPL